MNGAQALIRTLAGCGVKVCFANPGMSGRPAAALLHLGPGLGNGLANLHNARRGATPLLEALIAR